MAKGKVTKNTGKPKGTVIPAKTKGGKSFTVGQITKRGKSGGGGGGGGASSS